MPTDKKIDIYPVLLKILILVSPLIVYGYEFGGFSIRLSRLIILIIIPFLFFRITAKPQFILRDRFFTFGLLPFLVYSSIALVWASDPKEASFRLFSFFEMVLIYVAIIAANFDTAGFVRILKYYILSAVVPVTVSLWQIANGLLQFSSSSLPFVGYLIPGKYSVLECRYFQIGYGFSRLSSTFAEPNIFGGYLCSVLLLSLILVVKNTAFAVAFRVFQILLFLIMVLTLSKTALLAFFIGLFIICIKIKRFRNLLFYFFVLFFIIVGVFIYSGRTFLFERLLCTSGHVEFASETISKLAQINYWAGDGMGTSKHIFILTRIFESGCFMGLIFSILVTLIPLTIYRLKSESYGAYRMKIICTGASLAVVSGLYVYDYFVHMSTWVVIGLVMSFYNSERKVNLQTR